MNARTDIPIPAPVPMWRHLQDEADRQRDFADKAHRCGYIHRSSVIGQDEVPYEGLAQVGRETLKLDMLLGVDGTWETEAEDDGSTSEYFKLSALRGSPETCWLNLIREFAQESKAAREFLECVRRDADSGMRELAR